MRTALYLILMLSCAATIFAVDNITLLNVKEGLWEVTNTHSMSGMPGTRNIPPDVLAKMPADQRAKIEAMMSGKPTTDVRKECVTKEKLEKNLAFSSNRGNCTRNVITSTGSKLELKIHCEDKQSTSDGTFKMETLGSEAAKGTMHLEGNAGGQPLNIDFVFSSKYLGPACGDVK